MSIDDEWYTFLSNGQTFTNGSILPTDDKPVENSNVETESNTKVPIFDDLYISTKTKVLFLNKPIDIHTLFWKIPIIDYWRPANGIVKKQIKIVSKTPEEYNEYKEKLKTVPFYVENIIKQINNPDANRFKFKDERKITIGISKKDIMTHRAKIKNAFYNCFALIFRFFYDGVFREIHVKVFNTGKLEIPGILNMEILTIIKTTILEVIQPHIEDGNDLAFLEVDNEENVLINSNFNCNFYINREKLYMILKSAKYNIETAFEPCSYPGLKCKFYFNNEIGFDADLQRGNILNQDKGMKLSELVNNKKYTEISFMIFRTGSCLIVGNCTEKILRFVFEFIKTILMDEYNSIHVVNGDSVVKAKKKKVLKKTIVMTDDYYNSNCN